MIMCVLLCYPVSIHMSQLLSTGRPIFSSYYVHPPGGWIYYFCFFRRPMSDVRCPMSDVRCPMSDVRRPASDVRRHAWFPLI